ncbi:hypothetical protein K6V26_05030 [Parabacteroides goldsteinii]|nr:hypothetical protein [Parabacteroides goldsteinii]UBD75710.1 hypothetical protein K6V26_05030 [Parabacteroides goldsteinii]
MDEVMNRIPWCVVLAMINDQGKTRKKETPPEEEDVIDNEEEELSFLGLG